ncbi:Hepatitis A virus cellular receptor 1 [Oryzias melastigma]|uniref:Hepatitis A virus cellular receptor 1 n=1 Tax=Oryzias melastigma TaxID=30732 RepID=A0A834FCS6_ORYME|nr:Hepatitis A virus cellular receptor 1 [Oryzias melastigma]
MLLLLLAVWVGLLSAAAARVSAMATETVVGVAGRDVTLPCRCGAAEQGDVEVCWGRGEPSLFTCHNAVISGTGNHVTYRRSNRFSMSSSSSLSISSSRPADTGFYHCRVQLPGLFNDQLSIVHLLIVRPPASISQPTTHENERNSDAALTAMNDLMVTTGGDVTDSNNPQLLVARVQSQVQQREISLQFFIGVTLRFSSVIFIPLLVSALFYRVWRSNPRFQTDTRPDESEDEDDDSV